MKKLWILFPLWVFLLSYVFYRYEAGKESGVVSAATREGGAPLEIRMALPESTGSSVRSVGEYGPLTTLDAAGFERKTALGLAELEVFEGSGESSGVSFLWPVDEKGEPSDGQRLALAGRSDFTSWTPYEDDLVGFYVPGRGMEIDRVNPSEVTDVVAPMFLPSYAGAARTYRLRQSGITVAAVFVHAASEFDDSPRFPRAEEFHRYLFQNGAMARYSFAASGEVRRVQILGRKLRLTILDWPHCAMHQDIYRRFALSLHFREPVMNEADLRRMIVLRYGLEGRLGLLQRGTPESELNDLLGEPEGSVENLLVFCESSLRGEHHYRIALEDDMFRGFPEDWRELRRDPPAEFSLGWMLEKSETEAGLAGSVGYSLGPLSETDVEVIFERFLVSAPNAGARDWDTLCRIVANLAEKDLMNPAVVPVIRSRYLDDGLPQESATHVLHVYNADESREMFADRLRQLLVRSGTWRFDFSSNTSPLVVDESQEAELQILFAYIGKEYPTMPLLVQRAIEHSHPQVRAVGFSFMDWLNAEALPEAIERGLTDPHVAVRRRCAEFCAETKAPLPENLRTRIGECMRAESDVQTLSFLNIAAVSVQ